MKKRLDEVKKLQKIAGLLKEDDSEMGSGEISTGEIKDLAFDILTDLESKYGEKKLAKSANSPQFEKKVKAMVFSYYSHEYGEETLQKIANEVIEQVKLIEYA